MTNARPDGFLASPPSGAGPGVLVLHAWWGLNDTIKGVCNRLAQAGFTAFAPDLYHGQVALTIPEAEALGGALDGRHLEAKAEIVTAARSLHEQVGSSAHGIAVVGFSLGAYYALHLSDAAPELIRSVVVFYGTGHDDFSHAQAAYLGHFAENDPYEPPANVDALRAALQQAGRPATLHTYPATGHWFFEPDRPDAHNEAAAALAWDRTLAFLRTAA